MEEAQMTHVTRRGRWLVLVGLLAMAPTGLAQPPAPEVTEIRDFVVSMNGKQVGHNQLVIADRKDGTTLVSNKAHVQVKVLGVNAHTYTFHGTELWKGYQLLQLSGQCDDNKKTFTVQAQLDPNKNTIRVQANGKEQAAHPEAWSTSYWRLPDAKHHNKTLTLLDADRGEVIGGQLLYVGTEELTVVGKKQKCYHFKVNGPNPPVDVWFDVYHRLVRQEFTEQGHRIVIELLNVKR
jgi:hypothetical protein